jgi:hypothetical protein
VHREKNLEIYKKNPSNIQSNIKKHFTEAGEEDLREQSLKLIYLGIVFFISTILTGKPD